MHAWRWPGNVHNPSGIVAHDATSWTYQDGFWTWIYAWTLRDVSFCVIQWETSRGWGWPSGLTAIYFSSVRSMIVSICSLEAAWNATWEVRIFGGWFWPILKFCGMMWNVFVFFLRPKILVLYIYIYTMYQCDIPFYSIQCNMGFAKVKPSDTPSKCATLKRWNS